ARLDLGDELLRAVVLDLGLVMDVRLARRFEEGRIEDLFLDDGVRLERSANLGREILLLLVGACFLALLEPLLDLPMIRFQERDCVLAPAVAAARRSPSAARFAVRRAAARL